MYRRVAPHLLVLATLAAQPAYAQGVRAHTRPHGTSVSQSQAADLTLTLAPVAVRQVQVWVRTAGVLDASRRVATASMSGDDARQVKVGQRARVFSVLTRSSMYQAFVDRVTADGERARVNVTLTAQGPATRNVVVEIVTDRGELLAVPNEAIIEEGDSQVVYVRTGDGQYVPRTVHTGVQGELYTQVLDGVAEGDQVVTIGSFFIDADYKLKGTTQAAAR